LRPFFNHSHRITLPPLFGTASPDRPLPDNLGGALPCPFWQLGSTALLLPLLLLWTLSVLVRIILANIRQLVLGRGEPGRSWVPVSRLKHLSRELTHGSSIGTLLGREVGQFIVRVIFHLDYSLSLPFVRHAKAVFWDRTGCRK